MSHTVLVINVEGWLLPDPAEQFSNPYLAMGRTKREESLRWSDLASGQPAGEAVMYVDPDGEFITWSANSGGWSIGFNLTPIGIPIGAGFNFGTTSVGIYAEFGPRVGGTGFGSGATMSQSFDINTNTGEFSTTTAASAYASLGPASAGISYGYAHNQRVNPMSWNAYVGIGSGDDEMGMGLSLGYGSGGLTIGAGGYYNSKAWESNPKFDPKPYGDDMYKQLCSNCYTYALNETESTAPDGRDPGKKSGKSLNSPLQLEDVQNAAELDGLKSPTFWNRLGFGKRGHYTVYLVATSDGQDYHFYRQDKGGTWSHKRGGLPVTNLDAGGQLIYNPSRANRTYPNRNYNGGGIYLWVPINR